MSSSTTSGRKRPAASTADCPSAASPTTMVPSASSSSRARSRNSRWSSTISTVRDTASIVARTGRARPSMAGAEHVRALHRVSIAEGAVAAAVADTRNRGDAEVRVVGGEVVGERRRGGANVDAVVARTLCGVAIQQQAGDRSVALYLRGDAVTLGVGDLVVADYRVLVRGRVRRERGDADAVEQGARDGIAGYTVAVAAIDFDAAAAAVLVGAASRVRDRIADNGVAVTDEADAITIADDAVGANRVGADALDQNGLMWVARDQVADHDVVRVRVAKAAEIDPGLTVVHNDVAADRVVAVAAAHDHCVVVDPRDSVTRDHIVVAAAAHDHAERAVGDRVRVDPDAAGLDERNTCAADVADSTVPFDDRLVRRTHDAEDVQPVKAILCEREVVQMGAACAIGA